MVPKAHVVSLMKCREETALQTVATVRLVAEHYVKDCGYDGVNVLSASGKSAQQSVPHLHFHIIPRRAGDKLNVWPSLGKDDSDLEEIRQRLQLPSAKQETPDQES